MLASAARETPEVKAIRKAQPCAVNIFSEKLSLATDSGRRRTGKTTQGMGTGIVFDERGFIVTNAHVVKDVDSLRVVIADGEYPAEIVSVAYKADLAVIKIQPRKPLSIQPLGTSCDLMQGETVIALGNPFGYESSVSKGIISALERNVEVDETQAYENLLQTDAAINPGNSGGPLINLDGDVVGMSVAIRAGAQRIGFAIKVDDLRRDLAFMMNVEKLSGITHGLRTRDVKSCEAMRLVVDGFSPDSPAATAGFEAGDVIHRVGDFAILDRVDLERSFVEAAVGVAVPVEIKRGGESMTLQLTPVRFSGSPSSSNENIRLASTQDRAWRVLGLRLSPVTRNNMPTLREQPVNTAMKVVEVRPGSPAAAKRIVPNDLLVGLGEWRTANQENMTWIMDHLQESPRGQLNYVVYRGGTRYILGEMTLPSSVASESSATAKSR